MLRTRISAIGSGSRNGAAPRTSPGEDQGVGLVGDAVAQMRTQVVAYRYQDRDRAPPGHALRRPKDDAAVRERGQGRTHRDGRQVGGEIRAPQSSEFAVAQPGEGREQDHRPQATGYTPSEVEDLDDGGNGPLGGVRLTSTPDAAGIAADQVFVERRVQYALAIVVAVVPLATRSARQARTAPGVMSAITTLAAGRRGLGDAAKLPRQGRDARTGAQLRAVTTPPVDALAPGGFARGSPSTRASEQTAAGPLPRWAGRESDRMGNLLFQAIAYPSC